MRRAKDPGRNTKGDGFLSMPPCAQPNVCPIYGNRARHNGGDNYTTKQQLEKSIKMILIL